jgi:hypothetical protein
VTGKYCSQGTRYKGLPQTLTKEEGEEKEEEKDLKTNKKHKITGTKKTEKERII